MAETHTEETLFKVYAALKAVGWKHHQAEDAITSMQNMGILFRERKKDERYLDDAHTLEELVFQAIGAASMMWEHPERAGVFESDRAKTLGDELLARLRERYRDYGLLESNTSG